MTTPVEYDVSLKDDDGKTYRSKVTARSPLGAIKVAQEAMPSFTVSKLIAVWAKRSE